MPTMIGRPSGQLSLLELVGQIGPTLPGLDLHTAIPSAITEMAGWPAGRRNAAAEQAVDLVASGADALWADPGDAGRAEVSVDDVRRAITVGLAVLAYRPGGVSFGGLHWHARECDGCPGPGRWELSESRSRRTRGAYFTPRELAETIVENALGVVTAHPWKRGQVQRLENLRVADICCGSGAFLVAAVRYLAPLLLQAWDEDDEVCLRGSQTFIPYEDLGPQNLAEARAVIVGQCLYGVDIDPVSVALCKLSLQLLTPEAPTSVDVRVGDALIGRSAPALEADLKPLPGALLHPARTYPPSPHRFDWDTEYPDVFDRDPQVMSGFDAIIGNPPYLGGQKITGTFGTGYREHLVRCFAGGTRGSADLAAYFWLRAHQLANDAGVVGIVATNTLLQGATGRVGHDRLTRLGWRPYRRITSTPWPSRSAAVHCCLIWTAKLRHVPEHLEAVDSPL
jgi:hypothetical protein